MAIKQPVYADQFNSYLDDSGDERGQMCMVTTGYNKRPVIERFDVTYEGAVLQKYERNMYDDSDFLAVVWDEATQTIKHVEYATTRAYTYDCSATVDATPAVLEKVRAYIERSTWERWLEDNAKIAANPWRGKEVTVTGGRKHKGESGVVFWVGADQFATRWNREAPICTEQDTSRHAKRVGIERPDGTRFYVPADQATVDDPGQWLEPLAVGHEIAAQSAQSAYSQGQYRRVLYVPGYGYTA